MKHREGNRKRGRDGHLQRQTNSLTVHFHKTPPQQGLHLFLRLQHDETFASRLARRHGHGEVGDPLWIQSVRHSRQSVMDIALRHRGSDLCRERYVLSSLSLSVISYLILISRLARPSCVCVCVCVCERESVCVCARARARV